MARRVLTATVAAMAVGLSAALAQTPGPATAVKPKPKASSDEFFVTVTVTNSRKTDLVKLQVAESGSVHWMTVLGALKAGKQATAKVPQTFHCRVDVHGTFADGQSLDASDIEVCTQKTLNLTD